MWISSLLGITRTHMLSVLTDDMSVFLFLFSKSFQNSSSSCCLDIPHHFLPQPIRNAWDNPVLWKGIKFKKIRLLRRGEGRGAEGRGGEDSWTCVYLKSMTPATHGLGLHSNCSQGLTDIGGWPWSKDVWILDSAHLSGHIIRTHTLKTKIEPDVSKRVPKTLCAFFKRRS